MPSSLYEKEDVEQEEQEEQEQEHTDLGTEFNQGLSENRVVNKGKQYINDKINQQIKKGVSNLLKKGGTKAATTAATTGGGAAAAAGGTVAAGGAAASAPVWIPVVIIVLVIIILIAAIIMVLPTSVFGNTSKEIDGLNFKDENLIKEVYDMKKSEEEGIKPPFMERLADLYMFYEEEIQEEFGEYEVDEDMTEVQEEMKEDLEKAMKEVVEYQGDFAATLDIIPFLLKFERQSYAWSYPDWSPIINDTEKKIVKLYNNLYNSNPEKKNTERYIIKDIDGHIRETIYINPDFTRDQIFEEYKKVFSTESITLINTKTGRTINRDESLDRQLLKEQFDKVYMEATTSYERYLNLVKICDEAYKETSKIHYDTPIMYKADAAGAPITGEIYMTKSLLHRFQTINETRDITYKMTGYSQKYGDAWNEFNKNDANMFDEKDEMIKNARYYVPSTNTYSYTDNIIDFQKLEKSARLNWYYLNALLGEKLQMETGKTLTPVTEVVAKEVDNYKVIQHILAGSTPYFKYSYPINLTPLKLDPDTKTQILAKYGYDNFDAVNPFLPEEINGSAKYKFDNPKYPAGYLSITEAESNEIAEKIEDMDENSGIFSSIFSKIFHDIQVLSFDEEWKPASKIAYKPNNHEIADIINNYVTFAFHSGTGEAVKAYDFWADACKIVREKEVIFTNVIWQSASSYAAANGYSGGSFSNEVVETVNLPNNDTPTYTEPIVVPADNDSLTVFRTVNTTLPTVKPVSKSNLFNKKDYNYSKNEKSRDDPIEEQVDPKQSYVINTYKDVYMWRGSGEDLETQTDYHVLVKQEYHIWYKRQWAQDLGYAMVRKLN
ncbi:MAG: hypothetical protein A2Y22_04400 [Clostridiales bacterium GWD2_32_59]|nr:MAG: hypothetical protein A2Y22_04400 [Clostridiales bacterium GWD2_32_59]